MERVINRQQTSYINYPRVNLQTNSAVSQPIFESNLTCDTFERNNYNEVEEYDNSSFREELASIKSQQGLIGKLWDGFKNLTHIGASSDKVEDKIKQYENGEISEQEVSVALEKYKAGQNMVVDVVADMASGIIAVGAFALALPTGGGSLAAGLAIATAVGAGTKVAVKGGDALLTGKDYTGKDLMFDVVTGAVNGIFSPVSNGIGASVTRTIGNKMGLTIVKEGTEEIIEQAAKQSLKTIVTQQGVEAIGGTFVKRAAATAAGMAVDGAISGATDNMAKAILNGEDVEGVIKATGEGAVGGLIMAPIIGGGFKLAGKAGRALNNKLTTKTVLPDGINTKFAQGATGDCALLSTVDGLMNNPNTSRLIRGAITEDIGSGEYTVRIGSNIIKVAKDSLGDEALADVSGIRIFEQAYKQLNGGNLDGGFADVVAKQFGLNPIHITGDSLTDEMLDRLSKEQGSCILSFGAKIDADGAISTNGSNHYFTIKDIDTTAKKLTLSDTYAKGKTFDISYDEARKLGLSIDGGSTRALELPNTTRAANEVVFRGAGENPPSSTHSEIAEDIKEVVAKYNDGKIETARGYGRSTEVLTNWSDDFAVRNSDGVYQNAIDFLSRDGGAIDSYLESGFPKMNPSDRAAAKKLLVEYLENNLDIYTYDRLEGILAKFSKQIGANGKNSVIFIPEDGKSFGIIAEIYRRVNPQATILTGYDELADYAARNIGTNVAVLDDCVMSGTSVIDYYKLIKDNCPNVKDIDFYACTACEKGIKNVNAQLPEIEIHYDGDLIKPLEETDFYRNLLYTEGGKQKDTMQSFLKRILMYTGKFKDKYSTGSAIMFPYMAPNNNTPFSAKMIESMFSGPRYSIKVVDKFRPITDALKFPKTVVESRLGI